MVPSSAPHSTDPYENGLLTPDDVRDATFPSARLGRRGVDEEQVHAFCARVADQMTKSLAQRTALTMEVRRLRERMLEQSESKDREGAGGGMRPGITRADTDVQAVNVLTSAQRAADKYVAEAQDYSRELAEEARQRHDEILRDAQGRAKLILDEAESSAQAAAGGRIPDPGGSGKSAEAELIYLRTFSQVCRTHLRSYLDSLSSSLEEWEKAEEQGLKSARRQLPPPPASPPFP